MEDRQGLFLALVGRALKNGWVWPKVTAFRIQIVEQDCGLDRHSTCTMAAGMGRPDLQLLGSGERMYLLINRSKQTCCASAADEAAAAAATTPAVT